MLDNLFSSVLTTQSSSFSWLNFLVCTSISLVLGLAIALLYMYKNQYSRSFVTALVILPAIVQMVILLVNGNLGTGVAVAGTFSLVRFRSAQGSAREITSVFLAMAVGLATGTGYIGCAVLFVVIIGLVSILLTQFSFGAPKPGTSELRIIFPESLDYPGVFDELLKKYTSSWELLEVKTSNMGSLYKLCYKICLKDETKEKRLIDEIRCRNGNLEISSHLMGKGQRKEEL